MSIILTLCLFLLYDHSIRLCLFFILSLPHPFSIFASVSSATFIIFLHSSLCLSLIVATVFVSLLRANSNQRLIFGVVSGRRVVARRHVADAVKVDVDNVVDKRHLVLKFTKIFFTLKLMLYMKPRNGICFCLNMPGFKVASLSSRVYCEPLVQGFQQYFYLPRSCLSYQSNVRNAV